MTEKNILEESRLDDRSILILIAERQRVQGDALQKLARDLNEVSSRVTVLEAAANAQRGFLGGLRAVWVFVISLPLGVVAGWWGGHQAQ